MGCVLKGEVSHGFSGAEEIRTLYAMIEWLSPDLGRRSSRRAMIRSITGSSRALALGFLPPLFPLLLSPSRSPLLHVFHPPCHIRHSCLRLAPKGSSLHQGRCSRLDGDGLNDQLPDRLVGGIVLLVTVVVS
jgi:hypothetical protein